MQYEVENKYRVSDPTAFMEKLRAIGAELGAAQVQVDRYFAHPARDFASTDEALRIRSIGEENRITYKGPKIDRETKTRQETELSLEPGAAAAAAFAGLLECLGFKTAREVRKRRRHAAIQWQGQPLEICLDEIEGLGTFAEIEILATASEIPEAKIRLLSLAQELELTETERRSYLEMLLTASPEAPTKKE